MLKRTLATLSTSSLSSLSLKCAAYVPAGSGLHLHVSSQHPASLPPTYLFDAFRPAAAAVEPPAAVLEATEEGEVGDQFTTTSTEG